MVRKKELLQSVEEQTSLFEDDYLIRTVGEVVRRADVALSELVANAWDAGAETVSIQIPDSRGMDLVVEDDGTGMTREQFSRRWMTLGYNRVKNQGPLAEFPPGRSGPKRRSYGRNGAGRHALLCFGDEYQVQTWRDGVETLAVVTAMSGKAPLVAKSIRESTATGHGTRLIVNVVRNLPDPDRIREVVSSRFLHDPGFKVQVNGVTVSLQEREGLIGTETLKITEDVSVEVFVVEGDAGRTKHQSGIAFWVGGRLVGQPGWAVGETQIIDGRSRTGRRLTFIVMSDDLFDEVLPDWTGFRKSPLMELVEKGVTEHVETVLRRFLASKAKETTTQILRDHRPQLEALEPSARIEVAQMVQSMTATNPLIPAEAVSAALDGAIAVKSQSAPQALFEKIMNLPDEDIEGLNRLLDEWTVRDALTVLDEIGRRIRVVEALEKMMGDREINEVHAIHPLVAQARWLFGPEFESAEYSSNITIRKAVEKVFGETLPAEAFKNPSNRPDLLFLSDSTLSVVATEDFSRPNAISTLRSVLLIELKKGGATVGREAMAQAEGYIEDLLNCGLLDGPPYIHAFVVGDQVDPKATTVRKVGEQPENARIELHTFSQLVRTANVRLFRIRDRVKERYDAKGLDLLDELLGEPQRTLVEIPSGPGPNGDSPSGG
jgi:Histidine kinase-, DNA gyrase B-, and HSP90-like ATPase